MVAVILGYFLANEKVGTSTLLAAGFILGGVFLVSSNKGKKPGEESEVRERELVTASQE